jgi:uncharacterized protein (DUF697 family)
MSSEIAIGNTGTEPDKASKALAVLESLSRSAKKGIPSSGIMSAQQLAERYVRDDRYQNDDERVDSLIFHESSKNSLQGFITGLGGLITIPVTIPSDIAGSWFLQTRMVTALAIIYGNDPDEEAIQTIIFACILGEQALKVFREPTIKVVEKLTIKEISKIPGKTLTKINQAVGTRLITKFGEKGAINLGKLAPLVGGPINAAFDFFFCYSAGLVAKRVFGPEKADLAKTKLGVEVKGVIANATKVAARTSKGAAVNKLEDRKRKKEIKNLVKSLQSLMELSANRDIKSIRHRKEMILEKGLESRECLVVHAIKGNEEFREVVGEILVELCEPEDEVITKYLNSKDKATREFIFGVLEEVLEKESSNTGEGDSS